MRNPFIFLQISSEALAGGIAIGDDWKLGLLRRADAWLTRSSFS